MAIISAEPGDVGDEQAHPAVGEEEIVVISSHRAGGDAPPGQFQPFHLGRPLGQEAHLDAAGDLHLPPHPLGLPQLLHQLAVVDGNGRLGGDGCQELEIFRGERLARFLVRHVDDA